MNTLKLCLFSPLLFGILIYKLPYLFNKTNEYSTSKRSFVCGSHAGIHFGSKLKLLRLATSANNNNRCGLFGTVYFAPVSPRH